MAPKVGHPLHDGVWGITEFDAAVGFIGHYESSRPGDTEHLADYRQRVRHVDQHVACEHQIERCAWERQPRSVTLLERNAGWVAQVGRGLGDKGRIVLEACRGSIGKLLCQHPSRVASTASQIQHLGNRIQRDPIKDLASERIQHLRQQVLPFGVSFVDGVTHEGSRVCASRLGGTCFVGIVHGQSLTLA